MANSTHHLTINVLEFPSIMLRGHHVLICLRDTAGNYITARKDMYPEGITRFVGGGIEGAEAPGIAAQRELAEETGLNLPSERLQAHSTIIASVTDDHDRSVTFTTYLYTCTLAPEEVAQLGADDDVDELITLDKAGMQDLLKTYEDLSKEIDPVKGFAWFDYGQLYGYIHSLVLET